MLNGKALEVRANGEDGNGGAVGGAQGRLARGFGWGGEDDPSRDGGLPDG